MRRIHLLKSSVALVVATMGLSALAQSQSGGQQQSQQNQRSQQVQQGQQNQQSQPGFVIIDERLVYLLADQPQQHFVRALQDMAQGDNKKAASEISLAADYVDTISGAQSGLAQQGASKQAQDLRDLSKRVASGNVNARQLTQGFAQTNLDLAKLHNNNAQASLQGGKSVKAGYELRAASQNFEQALIWGKQQPQQGQLRSIADARQVSNQLISPQEQQVAPGEAQPAGAQMGNPPAITQSQKQQAQQCIQQLDQQINQSSSKFQGQQQPQGQPGQQGQSQQGDHLGR